MNQDVAVKIFEAGRSAGADFVEIFEEETRSSCLGLKDRHIETATAGTEYGIGVRLLYGTEVLYGFTSDDSEEALVKLVRTLAFGRISGSAPKTFEFAPEKRICDFNEAAYKDPRLLGQSIKQDFLSLCSCRAGVCFQIPKTSRNATPTVLCAWQTALSTIFVSEAEKPRKNVIFRTTAGYKCCHFQTWLSSRVTC